MMIGICLSFFLVGICGMCGVGRILSKGSAEKPKCCTHPRIEIEGERSATSLLVLNYVGLLRFGIEVGGDGGRIILKNRRYRNDQAHFHTLPSQSAKGPAG